MNINNLRDMLQKSCICYDDKVAFYEIKNGKPKGYTFRQLKDDVEALGTKLIEMGLKNKHIAIVGENSYSWVVSYLAVINGVGVAVLLDKELPYDHLGELIAKSDSEGIIFSQSFLGGIDVMKSKNENLSTLICMEENQEGYLNLENLKEEGRKLLQEEYNSYLEAEIDREALSILLFTSGTTGANKGVMLSHYNILSVVFVASEFFKEYKTIISVLPLHHIYENVCGLCTPINLGMTVYYNDSLKYLSRNLTLFKPEMALMVPLFLETMYKKITIELERRKVTKIFKGAVKVSNILLKIGIDLRRLLFIKIHKTFGGKLRTIVCGGAPLSGELIERFREIGIEVFNGYGITECAPLISVNLSGKNKSASVGEIIKCCDVMIDNVDSDGIGEILVSGDNVMLGYYKDEKATEESFYGDWFKTGDLGYMNQEKKLFLTGRKKNLIILNNGKNVHPEELEGYILKKMPYVQEVVVHTDKVKTYSEKIIAVAYIDSDFVKRYNIKDVEKKLEEDLREINMTLPRYKQIQDINIRTSEFEKNTSQKIIRYKI